MIRLDTSFLVDLQRESARGTSATIGRPGRAMSLLGEIEDEELAASVHVLWELEAGAERPRRSR